MGFNNIIIYKFTASGSAAIYGKNVVGLTSDHVLLNEYFCDTKDISWSTSAHHLDLSRVGTGSIPQGEYNLVFGIPE